MNPKFQLFIASTRCARRAKEAKQALSGETQGTMMRRGGGSSIPLRWRAQLAGPDGETGADPEDAKKPTCRSHMMHYLRESPPSAQRSTAPNDTRPMRDDASIPPSSWRSRQRRIHPLGWRVEAFADERDLRRRTKRDRRRSAPSGHALALDHQVPAAHPPRFQRANSSQRSASLAESRPPWWRTTP